MLVVIDMTERVKVTSEKQRVKLLGKTWMFHGKKGKANKGYQNKTIKEIKSSP